MQWEKSEKACIPTGYYMELSQFMWFLIAPSDNAVAVCFYNDDDDTFPFFCCKKQTPYAQMLIS